MSRISTTDRTAVFSMIKNEGDIIGDFLDQTLELFDFIYILDHESRDGTYEVCQQIAAKNDRVRLFRLDSSGYPQSQVTTWFTHEIFRRDNPEWLFLLDADEFLPFNSKKDFQAVLSKLSQDKCIGMVWRNILPEDLNQWKGLSATTFLEATKQGPYPKVAIPRAVMDEIGEELIVFQGNHGIGVDENHQAEVRDSRFVMYHLPYRSLQQAEQKLFLGNLAYYNDPSRRLGKGYHWRHMADEQYVSADTRQATIRDQVLFYGWTGTGHPAKDNDTFTPCTHRFNYPEACDRTILEQSRGLTSVLILWREIERLMASREEKSSTASAADYIISDSAGKIMFISSNKEGSALPGGENMPPSDKDKGTGIQQAEGDGTHGNDLNSSSVTDAPASLAHDASQVALLTKVYEWMNIPPSSVPPSGWVGHLAFVNALIGLARPSRIVELGVLNGCSFLAMCDACRTHGLDTELIGVDTWAGDPHHGDYNGDALYEDLMRQLISSYPMARLMRADFTNARERIPDGIIDLLHIDGYHTYEAVSHDFSTWFSSLSDRGICMFHDIAVRERNFGVYLLWDELKTKWPSMDFMHSYGLGVLFVGKNQPPAVKEFLSIWDSSETIRGSLRSAAELFASTFPARLQALKSENELTRLQNELVRLQNELVRLQNELQNEIGSMINSNSWRITAPLRFADRIVKSVFKGKTR